MAALKPDVKAFIIQALACFDTLSMVAEAVQKNLGLKLPISRLNRMTRQKLAGRA